MSINYPDSVDDFNVPSLPEYTSLSEAGDARRNHVEHHQALGEAVVAIEDQAAFKTHDHSGDGSTAHGNKLLEVYTHEDSDVDSSLIARHHTLGLGSTQAAPGNHVHSYNQLLDRPYIVCTTTTRPSDPFIGMMIYETDTNTVRIWAEFPTNPSATGVIGSDNFNRTADFDLDDTFWELNYLHAVSNGLMHILHYPLGYFFPLSPYAPYFYAAWWNPALTISNWVLARRVHDDDGHTDSDDQQFTCSWGDHDYEFHHNYGDPDACSIDHFLRMSDDHQYYVRVAIYYSWVVVYYTHGGPAAEIILGHFFIPVWEARLTWEVRALDWGFYLYRNGILVGTIFDNDHLHFRGEDYRGWGWGCHVVGHDGGQYRPPDVIGCQIKDNTSYLPVTRWGLLPVANIPILVAESSVAQVIGVGLEVAVAFGNRILEWVFAPFFSEVSDTDITITEPGVYHVHASICWDPARTFQDQALVSIKVNGQDIGRKNWEWIRGPISPYPGPPGFSQTNEINFWWRFEHGDVVRVIAKHNGPVPCWLWYDAVDPQRQVCHVELAFHSP